MSEAGVGLFALKKGPSPWQEDEKSRLEYESLVSSALSLFLSSLSYTGGEKNYSGFRGSNF